MKKTSIWNHHLVFFSRFPPLFRDMPVDQEESSDVPNVETKCGMKQTELDTRMDVHGSDRNDR